MKIYMNCKHNFYNNFSYLETAHKHINNIQQYENAPNEVIEIKEGQETEEFIKIWFNSDEKIKRFESKMFSSINSDMNHFYKDVTYLF